MNVDPNKIIAGITEIRLRKLLRDIRKNNDSVKDDDFPILLEETPKRGLEVRDALISLGYIEKNERGKWSVSERGRRVTAASGSKPLHRSTADKVYAEFLKRVDEVNNNPYYLHYVNKVIVFGSYLTTKERISDIDIAIEMERKHSDWEEHQALNMERYLKSKRYASDILDQICFSDKEVELFLKSRSRTLSIHRVSELKDILQKTETKIVYERAKN